MYILRADTGQAIEVNVSPTSSVQVLRDSIASLVPITAQDQILLAEGKRLDSSKTLEFYGLPSKDKEVFLFNRRAIADVNFPSEDSVPPPVETTIPPIRPLSKEYESKPLIQALKTYEHQFHYHFVVAQAIREAYERRLYLCKMLFSEEHVQVRGIECAILNLNDHMGQLVPAHNNFTSVAKAQSVESDELLDGFDSDLARLREVNVHPSLAAPGTTLLDCVPENTLRTWAKDGRRDNDHLKARIPDMENQVRMLLHEVDLENRKPHEVDFQELSNRIVHGDQILNEIVTKVQMFAKDFENVRNRVDAALRNINAQNVGSFCDGFDEIAKVHETHLAFLRAQDEASKENFVVFARAKAKLTKTVHARIRTVSLFQSRVRELHNSMAVLWEALHRLRAAFGQLAVVKNIPRAYQAALQEVARRRGFLKKLQREIARMNDTLAKLRQEENPKREGFVNKYYSFVPAELVPGLQESLPPLEITLPAFDMQLPPIDSPSSSHDDDDFTLVPFGDDPIPRIQSFDRENAFSQSNSAHQSQNPHSHTSSHAPSPYHGATSPPSSTSPISSVPSAHSSSSSHSSSSPSTPISTTKGFQPVLVNTSGGGTPSYSSSPSTQNFDINKLQKDLASAKEVASSYAERIKQLENELNKLYKEKVENTQHRVEATHISKIDPDTRSQLKAKDDTILSLRAELDSMRDKERETSHNDIETENLRSKIFEQEQQIERLMTALASSPSSHASNDPLVSSSAKSENTGKNGELERVLLELEEIKRAGEDRARVWEVERQEALFKYEGMMKQLTGELDNLREEKLHTSRRWDNEKLELEKTQKNLENLKSQYAQEQAELEQKIQQQTEQLEREKQEFESQLKELETQMEKRSADWDGEKDKLQVEIDESKKQYCKLMDEKMQMEETFRKELDETKLELENLKKDKANLVRLLEEVKASKLQLDNLLTEKEKELEAKVKKAEEAEKAVIDSKQKITNLEARNATLQKTCEDLETKSKNESFKFDNEKTTLEEQIRILRVRSEQLEKDRVDIVAKSEQLEAKIRSDSENFDSLKARYEELVVDSEGIQLKANVELKALTEEMEVIRSKAGEKDAAIREKDAIIDDKDAAMRNKDALIDDKDAALRDKETIINEKDAAIRVKEATISEKDTAMRAKDELLRTQDALLREKDAMIAQGEEMSRSVASLLESKEKGHSEEMLDYERRMMMMEERQKQEESDRYRMFELEREELVNSHNSAMEQLEKRITQLQNELKTKEQGGSNQLATLKNDLSEQKATIAELQSRLKDQGTVHQQEIAALVAKYNKKEADITEISVQIQKKNAALEKKVAEVEEEKQRLIQQSSNVRQVEGDFNNLRQVIVSVSNNLRDHIACKDLQYKAGDEIANFQMQVTAIVAHMHTMDEDRMRLVAEVNQHRSLLQVSESRRSDLDHKVVDLERRLQDTKDHLSALQMTLNENVPNKISFSKFKDGDLALFLPKGKFHEAFNINQPNYFLSEICYQIHENKTYICGQIIEISTRKATSSDNPFVLPIGTEFHEVTITSI